MYTMLIWKIFMQFLHFLMKLCTYMWSVESMFHYHVNGWFLSQKNYVHTYIYAYSWYVLYAYMRSVESTPSSFHYHVNGCFLSISLCSSPSRVTNSEAFFAPSLQFIFSKVCSFRQQAKCVLQWRWPNLRRCNIKS